MWGFQILIYGGLVATLATFILFILEANKTLKIPFNAETDYKKILKNIFLYGLLSSTSFLLLMLGLTLNGRLDSTYVLQATIGGFFLILFICWVYASFALYNFKKDLDKKFKPIVLLSMLSSLIPLIAAGWAMSEGLVPLITFPLPKGLPFNNPVVTFYALFILGGAVFVYFIGDLQLQTLGYKKGYIENVFYVAFPSGVIGARIWYVIGQWNSEFKGRSFWKVFAMWEGGLAIMGGALFGALAGVLFIYFRRKQLSIRLAADVALPVILVAQGIGRWGNFFNQEIYGEISDVSKWQFLPTFIQRQMTIEGQFRVPLFLIESIVNILGYLIIRFAIGKGLKKFLVLGDLAMMYPIWYGITRVIMEPLRNPGYIMDNLWSYYWGAIFAGLGVLGIVAMHLYDAYLKKRNKEVPTE